MAKKISILLVLFSLLAVPYTVARAIPTGVGIIGDSGSEPYQCIGRGNETSFTWNEELAKLRGINFGPGVCQEYNHAGSGETITYQMQTQTTEVLQDFQAGKIGKIIIFIGTNDLYTFFATPDVPALLATYRTNLNRLLKAGIAPHNILLIDAPWEEGPKAALVAQFNNGLRDLASEKGTAFSSFATYVTEIACRSTDGGETYDIGGHIIDNTYGDDWHNFRLTDGHTGTIANGWFANSMMADFLGVRRLSDAEILSLVNAKVTSSTPPPVCRIKWTLRSTAIQDGWILESSENSGQGGQLNADAATLFLGDNAQNKQYRSILSFSTKDLPDNAVITKVMLQVKKQGAAGKGDPVNTLQGFMLDVRKGFFGANVKLLGSDFQASSQASYGPYKPRLSNGWYSFDLTKAKALLNRRVAGRGVTQIRLAFKLDDNNNNLADYLKLYSGNAPVSSRPRLIIRYYIP